MPRLPRFGADHATKQDRRWRRRRRHANIMAGRHNIKPNGILHPLMLIIRCSFPLQCGGTSRLQSLHDHLPMAWLPSPLPPPFPHMSPAHPVQWAIDSFGSFAPSAARNYTGRRLIGVLSLSVYALSSSAPTTQPISQHSKRFPRTARSSFRIARFGPN